MSGVRRVLGMYRCPGGQPGGVLVGGSVGGRVSEDQVIGETMILSGRMVSGVSDFSSRA